jgi:hypothetical protein
MSAIPQFPITNVGVCLLLGYTLGYLTAHFLKSES